MTRMKKKYVEEVAPALMEKFQYKSVMQIPRIDKIEKLRGMNIAITTTAKTDEEARELLRLMGAPFMN